MPESLNVTVDRRDGVAVIHTWLPTPRKPRS
jgi:hypothetical protein